MKRKLIIAFVFVFYFINELSAQTFWKKYYHSNNDENNAFAWQGRNGNYFIVGETDSFPFVGEINNSGNLLWNKILVIDSCYLRTRMGESTNDGGFVITGYLDSIFPSSTALRVFLEKFDSLGNVSWSKIYSFTGGTTANYSPGNSPSVHQTFDNGYIIFSSNTLGAFVTKTDSSGNSIWSKSYISSWHTLTYTNSGITQTRDSGFIFLVRTDTVISFNNIQPDCIVIKTDINGNIQWNKTFRDTAQGSYNLSTGAGGNNIYETDSSGYVFMQGKHLVKINNSGDTILTRSYYMDARYYRSDFDVCKNGGYIISVVRIKPDSIYTQNYTVLFRTDLNGTIAWTKNINIPDPDIGIVLGNPKECIDGGFLLSGEIILNPFQGVVIKTDSTGSFSCFPDTTPEQEINLPLLILNDSVLTSTVSTNDFPVSITINSGILDDDICAILTNVPSEKADHEINIFPNPSTGIFEIINIPENSKLILTDIVGRIIYSVVALSSTVEINLANKTNGIYFCKIFPVYSQQGVFKVLVKQ